MNLDELRDAAEAERSRQAGFTGRVRCCTASGCVASGATESCEAFKALLARHGLTDQVEVIPTGCMGLCGQGPLVTVEPGEVLYQQVTPAVAETIVTGHLVGGAPVAAAMVDTTVPFFTSQVRIVNEHSGRIDATRIEGYLAAGGYEALAKAVGEMQPGAVIDEIRASGLRGRGGGGYPTGLKWAITRKIEADQKYVVC
nr:NAD(P)H-dependent oxidoreductase subunit E [Gemmatimonadales bacterium]